MSEIGSSNLVNVMTEKWLKRYKEQNRLYLGQTWDVLEARTSTVLPSLASKYRQASQSLETEMDFLFDIHTTAAAILHAPGYFMSKSKQKAGF